MCHRFIQDYYYYWWGGTDGSRYYTTISHVYGLENFKLITIYLLD